MKRALLVTTGTVVGVASVLAYKPTTSALGLVPGVDSLAASGVLESAAAAPTTTVTVTAEPTATAAAGTDATASPAATAAAAPSAAATASTKAAAPTTSSTASASASARSSSAAASASPSTSATESTAANGVSNTGPWKDGTFTGGSQVVQSHGRTYGTLAATVTVADGKITSIAFNQNPTGRNEQFIAAVQQYLVPEIIRQQNVTVGVVSRATGTSLALVYSLQSALQNA